MRLVPTWRFGPSSAELLGFVVRGLGGWLLQDTPGGVDELRRVVDPSLHAFLGDPAPIDGEAVSFVSRARGVEGEVDVQVAGLRVRRPDGRLAGTVMLVKPAASMAILGAIASMGDLRHLEQMQQVARAGRRPAAVLFADLEGSSPLARRLSTASYFTLGRRLVRACDRCVIDAGGLVGRHVGDGVTHSFSPRAPAPSRPLRAPASPLRGRCATRSALLRVRTGLGEEDVVLRFGLHWGSKIYVGAVTTGGRAEVTALGDEVNEAARIEACATGGRALASKDLVPREILAQEMAVAPAATASLIGRSEDLAALDGALEQARSGEPVPSSSRARRGSASRA